MELIDFHPEDFGNWAKNLQANVANLHVRPDLRALPVPSDLKPKLIADWQLWKEKCERAELQSSVDQIERIMKAILRNDSTYEAVYRLAIALYDRVADDLARSALKLIPAHQKRFYCRSQLFGDEVAERFPSANFDIEEAGSCLAVGRIRLVCSI